MKGLLYGVGVGPGDPKLLTIKAVETIKKCSVIAVPHSGAKENIALKIVEEYTFGKEILNCLTPMDRDKTVLRDSQKVICKNICSFLEKGQDVCFITLGDVSIYSTYMYIHSLVIEQGFEAEIIPGVPSFCAVAAALGISLCEGGEPLHIIPSSYDGLEQGLSLDGTKVLMKSGGSLESVVDLLREKNLLKNSQMVEKCTMADQKIYRNLDAIENRSYFSTIIVKGR